MNASDDRRVTLRDGRRIKYAEYGDPSGKPVLYCHGSPGSRLDFQHRRSEFARAGVRLIAPDRPGIGGSDFARGYLLLDWADDAAELLDLLLVDRAAVVGVSGGGPFAAALAFRHPRRVAKVALVGAVGPLQGRDDLAMMSRTNRRVTALARSAQWLLWTQYWLMGLGLKNQPDRVLSSLKSSLPAPDATFLESSPREMDALLATMREALRAGARPVTHEWALFLRPWGFAPHDITAEATVWHGTADTNVPISVARRMAAALQRSSTRFLDGEGHFSLAGRHLEAILADL